MKHARTNLLITKADFSFQAWPDRYGKGVWAALGFWESEIDTVRDLSSSGSLDMRPATHYILGTDWLPYIVAPTLEEAMDELETRLASLPPDQLTRDSQWSRLVNRAVEALAEATRGRSWYGDTPPETLADLPATFADAISQSDSTP